jgi:hypothetical protein
MLLTTFPRTEANFNAWRIPCAWNVYSLTVPSMAESAIRNGPNGQHGMLVSRASHETAC